ncbi:MAG: hypothetical protein PUP93_31085, partial [Rhizonema sp. NSF051]|nr:hypothetical protein [Rhizonema sp. NSF051]
MTSGFNRQEAIILTEVTSSKLSYLDSINLVSPEKFGNPKHPKVIYSWQKIIKIKIIDRLKEKLSSQEIQIVLDFLHSRDYVSLSFYYTLVFIDKDLY